METRAQGRRIAVVIDIVLADKARPNQDTDSTHTMERLASESSCVTHWAIIVWSQFPIEFHAAKWPDWRGIVERILDWARVGPSGISERVVPHGKAVAERVDDLVEAPAKCLRGLCRVAHFCQRIESVTHLGSILLRYDPIP